MNNQLTKQPSSVANVVNQVGIDNPTTSALTAKSLAEVQGKVFMAKQFPRDMELVMRKIQSSCERKSLAEIAEYEYPRGGTMVIGASIRLLETVAQCYGNIYYTWKEISRDAKNHRSICIADAWDLENNVSSSLEFEVAHYRDTRSGSKLVTEERDLYELIASNAARRVRKCLENVIPRDIVDQAREWTNETLKNKVDIQAGIDKALEYFKTEYGITTQQVEEYFGINRRGFTKNTYLTLQKLYNSFKDGLSKPEEMFPPKIKKDGVGSLSKLAETKEPGPKLKPIDEEKLDRVKSKKIKVVYDEEDGEVIEEDAEPTLFDGEF